MHQRFLVVAIACLFARFGHAADTVDYIRDIKPILSNSCYTCHGPDESARQADLRFDRRDVALSVAIVPGDAAASEMIARVTSGDPETQMPPPDSRRARLTNEQVSLLSRWIEEGANYRRHWAYEAPQRPDPPHVSGDEVANPIDRFVIARLQREGMTPSPAADQRTQIRRLYFDLLGLPPTPEVVEEQTQRLRSDPRAYPRLVGRLLASPAFGERMATYWLDVVRYADTVGIHGDQLNSMSPYRDYVLAALNQNLPFDQFLTEQIAGDLLPDPTLYQKVASAYNRLHMITSEGGAQDKEYLAIYSADRVRNTAAALLGTTLGCAQCHDHKFDPFSSKEFYQFAAFFADLKETGVYNGSNWFPKLQVPERGQAARLKELDSQVQAAEERVKQDAPDDDPQKKRFLELKKHRDQLEKTIPTVLVSQSVAPREMRLLPRGNWLDDSGPVVQPGFPAALAVQSLSYPPGTRLTRLDLAQWLTHPQNPLVARVFVNRLWKLMFGEGLVSSLDDFGSQGTVPSHPQLLDWLATEFVDSGWDIKHMLRLIVTSRIYRQTSNMTAELRQRDPTNRLLARQNRFRLDAEFMRDSALAISQLLVHRLGGPSVRPYQPAGYYAHLNFPRRTYQHSTGADLYRRSVYTHWQRTFLHPNLMAFDAPSREECTVSRPRSNTPLQSLVLLNDPIYVETARKFAERILAEKFDSAEQQLRRAFLIALQRKPRPGEERVLLGLLSKHQRRYRQDISSAKEILNNGVSTASGKLDIAELAAWTSVSRVILSLHETITRS